MILLLTVHAKPHLENSCFTRWETCYQQYAVNHRNDTSFKWKAAVLQGEKHQH